MAYYTHTRAPGAFERWLTSAAHTLEETAEKLAQHRMYRETLSELRALSDRELADLGMHRAGLKAIAAEAVRKNTAH